ncbi:MAG: BlaI/MecI/CopY family transcriptional regulator [Oscillospiraceae bacterium]|nr:BlaI/MecI/CopY family transcriptional regulator [Oscillospiraceae bacterium]
MYSKFNLTNNEWEIYECLWEASPLTLVQIARRFVERTGLARTTGETMVLRMEKKGLFRVEKGGRAKLYYPIISRDEASRRETRSFLDRVYGGKIGLLVNAMADEELTSEDIDELYSILKKAEEKRNA